MAELRLLFLTSLISVISAFPGLAQRNANMSTSHERLYAVVPVVGAGTMADPQRPKYAPLLSPQSPQSQSGILGYQFVVGDDGLALVEFVGATRAAFAPLLADPSIKVFLRGRNSREAMEAEFLKHKKNFDFVHFGVLMP